MKTCLALLMMGVCLTMAADPAKESKPSKPAKVVITAEVACMHCTFGLGDSCATCLKLDDDTPILLEGKAAKELFPIRLKEKTAVVEGTLKVKGKQLVLVADKCRLLDEKDKK